MRRLAVCAYAFSAAAFLLGYLRPSGRFLLVSGAVLLACWLASFCLRRSARLLPILRALLLGIGLSCLLFALWDRWVLREAEKLAGEERAAEATVLDFPSPTTYGESVTLRIGRVKCRLYLDEGSGLTPGERITVSARFRLSEETTGADSFLSAGLPLFGYGGEVLARLGPAKGQWRYFPAKLGAALRANIAEAADGETAPFLIAILTGERSALRADTWLYSMMREAGVLHCIAVSGMHLSFLVSFLAALLGKGRHTSLICIPVILLFMAVTGFTASVVRSGIMLLALSLSQLLNREYDAHTALALSLGVLAALNPISTHNVGLLLSFLSTLGILLFARPLSQALPHLTGKKERGFLGGCLRYVRSSLAVSLSALILTLPVTALCFGQIPLLGPLANLLILWAVTLSFGLGLLAALLGFLWPFGASAAAWAAGWPVRYIALVVKTLGRLPFASLYPQNPMVALWLICLYGLLLYARFRPGLTGRMRLFFSAAGVTLLLSCALGVLLYRQDALRVGVLDVEQGQCVVLTGPDFVLVSDCGSSNASYNAGDIAARYLLARGRLHVDAAVVSHYDADHVNGFAQLLRRLPVDTLYLPPPAGEGAEALLAVAESRKVRVVVVSEETETVTLGGLEATIVPPLGSGSSNEEGLIALYRVGSREVLVTGDASRDTELRLLERLEMPDVELLIAGHHGSASSTSETLLEASAPDVAVISVGRNSYGLPAQAVLSRLEAAGAAVYRTDRNGTVEVCYPKEKGVSSHG